MTLKSGCAAFKVHYGKKEEASDIPAPGGNDTPDRLSNLRKTRSHPEIVRAPAGSQATRNSIALYKNDGLEKEYPL